MPSYRYTLSSGQSFLAPGETCADVRQAVHSQFGASVGLCGSGDDLVIDGTAITYMDPATGVMGSSSFTVSARVDVVDPPMQWGSEAMLLQVAIVATCVFALLMGIRAGDRL